ncbi:hypothetical protein K504DRAFT_468261 [Pleomassaria siparia CBS 279.74]|uniref:Uncharacterized protein n=1 Tax=Pleomassaria siparia CBS 279.74 TaxID=1314801 RepID=A0A6G1K9K6_9PLEO|nr:hypothetical protein K504DRAFT_468261 [Pleomassaria siparia CBS 279.74]
MLTHPLPKLLTNRGSDTSDITIRCLLILGSLAFVIRVLVVPALNLTDLLSISVIMVVWYSRRTAVYYVTESGTVG